MDDTTRTAYLSLRAQRPDVRAADAFSFITDPDRSAANIDQYLCRHEWTGGYDDSDNEVPVYCLNCGMSGDV